MLGTILSSSNEAFLASGEVYIKRTNNLTIENELVLVNDRKQEGIRRYLPDQQ